MAIAYSALLRGLVVEGAVASLTVPADWMQGRSVFGGLQAAIALGAMRALVPEAPLRTLQATFAAPVAGGVVRAAARVLRTGKSATHVEARIMEGDATLALFVAVFGTSRPSTVSVRPHPGPATQGGSIAFPYVPGVTPDFTQHFEVAWLRGLPPFRGDAETAHVLELRMRDDAPATEAHVLAIADFIPPIGLSHLRAPAAGSTLTWMLELLGEPFAGLPLGGWRLDAELIAAQDGYTSQSVMVWGPGGVPVALSRQSMVIFG